MSFLSGVSVNFVENSIVCANLDYSQPSLGRSSQLVHPLCQAVATGGEKTGDPEILGSGTVFESQMFSGHTGLPGLPRSVLDQSIDVMLCPVLRGGHLQKGKCKKDNALGRV